MKRVIYTVVAGLALGGGLWWFLADGDEVQPKVAPRVAGDAESRPSPTVRGAVVDSRGEPVAGATVEASRGGQTRTVSSGEDGSFEFADLEPGSYAFDVRDEGFAPPAPKPLRRVSVEVPPEAERDGPVEVELTLRRPGRLTGRVVAGESAVAGARLTLYYLYAEGFRGGLEPFTRSNVARSSEDGSFAIEGVAPGRLRIIVEAPGHASQQSRELLVEPGDTLDDLAIDLEPEGVLAGTVVDGQGQPVAADVELSGGRLRAERRVRAGEDGRYRFGALPSGTYTVRVRAPGYLPAIQRNLEVRDGEVTDEQIALQEGEGLFGRVVGPDARPVGGAFVRMANGGGRVEWTRADGKGRFEWTKAPGGTWSIRAFSPRFESSEAVSSSAGRGVELQLGAGGFIQGRIVDMSGSSVSGASLGVASMMVDGPRPWGVRAVDVRSVDSEDGTFRFGPLRPGRYELEAKKEPYAPAETSRITVESGETVGGIEIALGTGGTVEGVVRSKSKGKPLSGARVSLLDMTSPFESPTAETDQNGQFEIDGVPAGRRSLEVAHDGHLTRVVSGVQVPAGGSVSREIALRRKKKGQEFGFQGIGASLRRTDDGVVIQRLIPGGGAEKSGLQRGDEIRAVDGAPVDGQPLSDIVQKIRGRAGEPVELSIDRDGRGRFEVRIERGRVVVEGNRGRN